MARRTMREPECWHRPMTLAAWEDGGSAVLQVDGQRPSVRWLVEPSTPPTIFPDRTPSTAHNP